jgi:hypothetical protein
MDKKRPKHRSESTQAKRKATHREKLRLKSIEKKANIILHTPPPEPSLPPEPSVSRALKRAAFKERIREKYGLPADTTFIQRGNHGQNPHLELKFGTVVVLDSSASKLVAVIRFNERQFTETEGKLNQTEDSKHLFRQFGQTISTMYKHGLARNNILTNGPWRALGKRKRGSMFAIGMRAGYRKGVYGGKSLHS